MMVQRVPTFCGKDCGGNACPLVAVVEDGEVTRLERNPAAPGLKPCPRGYSLHEEHYARDRLLSPLVADGPRGSGRFREVGWDQALGLVARRLGETRERLGPSGVMGLGGAGSTGALHNSEGLLTRLLAASGGGTGLSSNYSNGAARFVLPYLFGDAAKRSGWDASTVRHSRLVVLWGANILEARLGTELGPAVAAAARAGTPVIVIDPRRTRTAAALGARWIPIRPGTDAAMMLAVLYSLFKRGLVDMPRASRLAVGMEDLERYVSGAADGVERSPAWAERACGVDAATIESFAVEYAAASPAMLVPGYSIQRVLNGEESYRLSAALQVATGNFGIAGGSTGSLNNRLPTPRAGSFPDLPAGDYRSAPILRWPDAVLEGRRGGYPSDVGAAYVAGFNAVNQGADCLKSKRAMESLEFSVCHELFMTPTARLCDVVLPVCSALEKEDLGAPWLGDYLLYKKAAVPPRGLARSDYDVFRELSERMGFGEAFSGGRSASEWLERFVAESEAPDADAFRATGVYIGEGRDRVGLSDFAADPEANPLPTPSGRVELRSEAYARDTGRSAVPAWTDPPADPRYPFSLITPKTIRRTHSQGGGRAGPDSGELTIAAEDAARLGVRSGDGLVASNDRGAVLVRALVSDDIAPGVVSLHEGAWLELGPDGVDRGGSANALTSTDGSGPAVAPVMHGIPVAIYLRSSG